MSEAKHSPLPWGYYTSAVVEGILMSDNDEIGLLEATNGADEPKPFPAEANAAFIVKAVNAHYELVEALRKIERALLSDPPDGGPQKYVAGDDTIYRLDGQAMYVALNAAREALAKVSS